MSPSATSAVIPNPYNQILSQKHGQVIRAIRYAAATVCDTSGKPAPLSSQALRRQLKTIPIAANITGLNVLIPPSAGVKQIFEIVLWNGITAQNITLLQGIPNAAGNIVLLDLGNFPNQAAFVLGFNGNWDMPHFELENGQALMANITVGGGATVTGFIRYRVVNGTI